MPLATAPPWYRHRPFSMGGSLQGMPECLVKPPHTGFPLRRKAFLLVGSR